LLFCPAAAPVPLVIRLLPLATQAVSLRDKPPLSAVLTFVHRALCPSPAVLARLEASRPGATDDYGRFLSAWMGATPSPGGPTLLRALLEALVATAPRECLRAIGSVLHALLTHERWGEAMGMWLAPVLADVLARGGGREAHVVGATPREGELFVQIGSRASQLRSLRFQAACLDFGAICRREASGDALMGYLGDEG
jgi:hypothetical protein